jgi:hypothetical protein
MARARASGSSVLRYLTSAGEKCKSGGSAAAVVLVVKGAALGEDWGAVGVVAVERVVVVVVVASVEVAVGAAGLEPHARLKLARSAR